MGQAWDGPASPADPQLPLTSLVFGSNQWLMSWPATSTMGFSSRFPGKRRQRSARGPEDRASLPAPTRTRPLPLYSCASGVRSYTYPRYDTQRSSAWLCAATSAGVKKRRLKYSKSGPATSPRRGMAAATLPAARSRRAGSWRSASSCCHGNHCPFTATVHRAPPPTAGEEVLGLLGNVVRGLVGHGKA